MRSFRAERVSAFVKALLDCDLVGAARQSLAELRDKVDRDAEPLHAALLKLVTTLEKMHQIEVGNATPSLKQTLSFLPIADRRPIAAGARVAVEVTFSATIAEFCVSFTVQE
jgi:hypothetical protein